VNGLEPLFYAVVKINLGQSASSAFDPDEFEVQLSMLNKLDFFVG